ncbi:restriction endonuclease subunit S [Thiovibrio sp. JS02]
MIQSAPLGKICNVTTGQSAPQDPKAFTDEGIPFIRAGSLEGLLAGKRENQFELINESNAKKFRLKLFPKDTVIFAKSGMSAKIGRVYRLDVPCYLVSHLAAVSPSANVNPGYLHRWFEGNPPSRLIENDAYPSIKTSVIQRIEIPLPPFAEQKRIAAILDAADGLRAKRRESLAQLDTLLQSTFLDMFGDPVGNGWAMVTVEDVARTEKGAIRTGPFGSQLLHSEFVDEGVTVLGIDNVVANEFRDGEPRFITSEKYAQLKRYTVKPGDVLITIMGTCGRCAVVPEGVGTAINTKHLCCITLDHSKCLPSFMHRYFLMHPSARKYLERSAKGAIMSGLNMGIVKALPIPIPPIDLQQRFATIVESVEQQKARLRQHLAELDTLFASLQQRAFSGEL